MKVMNNTTMISEKQKQMNAWKAACSELLLYVLLIVGLVSAVWAIIVSCQKLEEIGLLDTVAKGLFLFFITAIFVVFFISLKNKAYDRLYATSPNWKSSDGRIPECSRVNAEHLDGSIDWNQEPSSLEWGLECENPITCYMVKKY